MVTAMRAPSVAVGCMGRITPDEASMDSATTPEMLRGGVSMITIS